MDSYKKYQIASQSVRDAKNWMSNKDKIDSQCNTKYSLAKLAVQIECCGQSSAGETNYHKSPEKFNDALSRVIRADFAALTGKALELLKADERAALIACKTDVYAMQREISDAEMLDVAEAAPAQ